MLGMVDRLRDLADPSRDSLGLDREGAPPLGFLNDAATEGGGEPAIASLASAQ